MPRATPLSSLKTLGLTANSEAGARLVNAAHRRTLTRMRRSLLAACFLVAAPATAIASVSPGSERVDAANSSAAWIFSPGTRAVDLGGEHGEVCPYRLVGAKAPTYECSTEYRFDYPDGLPGTRIFLAEGAVTWTHVRLNPLGPGSFGIAQSSVVFRSSWVRRWHQDTGACLRSWHVSGDIQSNFPCAADDIAHGTAKEGADSGTGTGAWATTVQLPLPSPRSLDNLHQPGRRRVPLPRRLPEHDHIARRDGAQPDRRTFCITASGRPGLRHPAAPV
jgi:hypothetical protein